LAPVLTGQQGTRVNPRMRLHSPLAYRTRKVSLSCCEHCSQRLIFGLQSSSVRSTTRLLPQLATRFASPLPSRNPRPVFLPSSIDCPLHGAHHAHAFFRFVFGKKAGSRGDNRGKRTWEGRAEARPFSRGDGDATRGRCNGRKGEAERRLPGRRRPSRCGTRMKRAHYARHPNHIDGCHLALDTRHLTHNSPHRHRTRHPSWSAHRTN